MRTDPSATGVSKVIFLVIFTRAGWKRGAEAWSEWTSERRRGDMETV